MSLTLKLCVLSAGFQKNQGSFQPIFFLFWILTAKIIHQNIFKNLKKLIFSNSNTRVFLFFKPWKWNIREVANDDLKHLWSSCLYRHNKSVHLTYSYYTVKNIWLEYKGKITFKDISFFSHLATHFVAGTWSPQNPSLTKKKINCFTYSSIT